MENLAEQSALQEQSVRLENSEPCRPANFEGYARRGLSTDSEAVQTGIEAALTMEPRFIKTKLSMSDRDVWLNLSKAALNALDPGHVEQLKVLSECLG